MEGGSRRLTLYDQMSAADGGREREPASGMIDGVLAWEKRASPQRAPSAQLSNRTLLDVIRDDEPNTGKGGAGHRDKRSWKSFRDRLRLKRAGGAWTSSVPTPTSDIPIPIQNRRSGSLMSRRNSVRFDTVSSNSFGVGFSQDATQSNGPSESGPTTDPSPYRPQISRRCSSRYGPNAVQPSDPIESDDSSGTGNIRGTDVARVGSFRPQMSRHNSTRFSPAMDDNMTDPTEPTREGTRRLSVALAEERELSAREAVAAQEAAEAEAAAIAAETREEEEEEEEEESNEAGPEATQPIRMSLMDLLEETDRQMGLVGARYGMGGEEDDEEDDDYEDEEEEEEEEEPAANGGGGAEYNCCVCMVRHKGSAFIPCGHTFCRLCSRELWVSRGNCPLCNGFILEILDIF